MGRDPKRAQAFAERFNSLRVAQSLDALVQEVDAIYVAVPPVAHVPIAKAAVEAGRHVLIEKPLSPTFGGYEMLSTRPPTTRRRGGLILPQPAEASWRTPDAIVWISCAGYLDQGGFWTPGGNGPPRILPSARLI